MSTETRRQRWLVPVTGLVIGVAYVVVFLVRREPAIAVFGFVLMAGYAVFLVLGSRRSEAVALLRGELSDERRTQISLKTSTFTLNVLTLVLVGGFLVELIRGHSGDPWTGLCAVLGLSYMGSTVYYSRKS